MSFDAAAPENAAADDDDAAALLNPKVVWEAAEGRVKEKTEELDEVEADVNEGVVVEVAIGVELSVLFGNGELPKKENPVEAENGEVVVEFEAELDDMKLAIDGVVAEDEEPKELVIAVGAGEDEIRVEPPLAPNMDGDAPTLSEN